MPTHDVLAMASQLIPQLQWPTLSILRACFLETPAQCTQNGAAAVSHVSSMRCASTSVVHVHVHVAYAGWGYHLWLHQRRARVRISGIVFRAMFWTQF